MTKLSVPFVRPSLVARPGLSEKLGEGLGRKLTLLSAPAGFGKTTLLSSWIGEFSDDGRPIAWLSLDPSDNDPARFWRYLVTAIDQLQPGSGEPALALLGSPQAPSMEAVLTTLLNDLADLPTNAVLVLDDYHLIETRAIHDALTFLIEHLPPRLHLAIATRADPPLAARFREGNVFLCGDAAHVHSPAGGQGMNTGIQDAANLAWKIALALRGRADEGANEGADDAAAGALLDSYEAERRQVALGVISTTHRLTRLATVRSPVARRLRNILLAAAGRDGRLPRRLATNLAEIDIVYRDGWSADGSTAVGRWAPKRGVAQAENLDPASAPAFRLVVPEGHEGQVLAAAARFPDLPVRVVPIPGIVEASLVRPDGYVAGRGGAGDAARLLGQLARMLGAAPARTRGRAG